MSMYDQKPLQYCKVISLQLIKINGKKKKKELLLYVHQFPAVKLWLCLKTYLEKLLTREYDCVICVEKKIGLAKRI